MSGWFITELQKVYVEKKLDIYNFNIYKKLTDINNSHIPKIVAYEEKGGSFYMVEEYVSGETLQEKLHKGHIFSEKELVEVLVQLCEALECLHGQNPPVIHRDIKPSNIMISDDGIVKLIDYNAARFFESGMRQDTMLIGTAGYAAPEQYGFAQTDARTDIYSCGVLMNTMLTGQPLSSQAYNGKIGKIIKKCTYMDPDKRYKNIGEVKRALLGGESVQHVNIQKQTDWMDKLWPLPGFRSDHIWKKLIALLGYLCIVALSFSKEITVETSKTVQKTTFDIANDSSSAETESESTEQTAEVLEVKNTTVSEQVLLEWEGLKITAKEFVTDSIWGDGIKVLIENESDKNLGIGCNALIVNNYMITDLFSETVASGKKSNETIYISSSQLEAAGIDNVGEVEIYFHIFDGDSYQTLYDAERVAIQTSSYGEMDTEVNEDGQELLNQDGIRIIGKYVDEDSFWGKAILLYIENNSGKNVGINCDDLSINGFMVTPLFSSTVYDGKKAIDDITLMSTELEENGIEEVEEVELKFHVYNAESYNTIFDSEVVTFTVK